MLEALYSHDDGMNIFGPKVYSFHWCCSEETREQAIAYTKPALYTFLALE